MTPLTEYPIGALQEMYRVAEANGWEQIKNEVAGVMVRGASDALESSR